MQRFRPDSRHDRHNPRALRVAFGITAVGAALLLAACSSSSSFQQIFYGAALVASITIPKVTRDRFFKRRRAA